jgi:hypothetical protein
VRGGARLLPVNAGVPNSIVLPEQAQLCAEAHPFLPGGALLGVATNMGTVALLEMVARSEARLIGRDKLSTIGPIVVGLGFNLATSTVCCCSCWCLGLLGRIRVAELGFGV